MLCTGKWVKKIVSFGGVFDLAVEQPQLFRKLSKNKTKNKWQVYDYNMVVKNQLHRILVTATVV